VTHVQGSVGVCECGHPWFDHDRRGCGVDSFLHGPCPCKLTGPPTIDALRTDSFGDPMPDAFSAFWKG
jgi:hypothetical protein